MQVREGGNFNSIVSTQQISIFKNILPENCVSSEGKVCPTKLASHCSGGKTIKPSHRYKDQKSLIKSLSDDIDGHADVGAQADIDATQWSILQLMLLGLHPMLECQLESMPPLFPPMLSPFTIKMRILLSK